MAGNKLGLVRNRCRVVVTVGGRRQGFAAADAAVATGRAPVDGGSREGLIPCRPVVRDRRCRGEGLGDAEQLGHWASLAARSRWLSNPDWRIRRNPSGKTWSRKRRMNSATGEIVRTQSAYAPYRTTALVHRSGAKRRARRCSRPRSIPRRIAIAGTPSTPSTGGAVKPTPVPATAPTAGPASAMARRWPPPVDPAPLTREAARPAWQNGTPPAGQPSRKVE